MELETRTLSLADLGGPESLRLDEGPNKTPKIVGMAPPWNSWSVDLGGFREQFAPGAFSRCLERHRNDPRGGADVIAAWDHDEARILGRTTNGTLDLQQTARGLEWAATPPKEGTPTTAEVFPLIRGGYVFGCSFAFSVPDENNGQEWTQDGSGYFSRTIKDADLYHVSPVSRAAYPRSQLAMRSLELWKQKNLTSHEIEQIAERAADQAADAVRAHRMSSVAAAAAVARLRTHGR